MQISSYTFQSPYPQPFQVGRPDPASSKQDDSDVSPPNSNQERQPSEAKLSPTKEVKGIKETQISTSIGALADGNAQNGVAAFKALSTSIQGQKAYAKEAVS